VNILSQIKTLAFLSSIPGKLRTTAIIVGFNTAYKLRTG